MQKNKGLYFAFMYCFPNAPLFFEVCITDLYHFSSLWRTYLNIPCKAGSLAMHSLNFVCFSSAGLGTQNFRLMWGVLSVTLNISLYSLLACTVSEGSPVWFSSCCSTGQVLFPSRFFQDVLFVFDFLQFRIRYSKVQIFLYLSCFVFCKLTGFIGWGLSLILEVNFSVIIISSILLFSLLLMAFSLCIHYTSSNWTTVLGYCVPLFSFFLVWEVSVEIF